MEYLIYGAGTLGLLEWIAGYQEVLADGIKCGLSVTIWKSYEDSIDKYFKSLGK